MCLGKLKEISSITWNADFTTFWVVNLVPLLVASSYLNKEISKADCRVKTPYRYEFKFDWLCIVVGEMGSPTQRLLAWHLHITWIICCPNKGNISGTIKKWQSKTEETIYMLSLCEKLNICRRLLEGYLINC